MADEIGNNTIDDYIILSDDDVEGTSTTSILSHQTLDMEPEDKPSDTNILKSITEKKLSIIHPACSAKTDTSKEIQECSNEDVTRMIENTLQDPNRDLNLSNLMGNMRPSKLAVVAKYAMIDIVQKFPALWQSTHPYYYNIKYCSLLWTNIAGALNTDVKSAKNKWRKLRELYKKEYLKSTNSGVMSKHPCFKRLSFLKDEILSSKYRLGKRKAEIKTSASSKQNCCVTSESSAQNSTDPDEGNLTIIDMEEAVDKQISIDSQLDVDVCTTKEQQNSINRKDSSHNANTNSTLMKPSSYIKPKGQHPLPNKDSVPVSANSTSDLQPQSDYLGDISAPKSSHVSNHSNNSSDKKRHDSLCSQSPSHEIEYCGKTLRKKTKIFVTNAFPEVSWSRTANKKSNELSISNNTSQSCTDNPSPIHQSPKRKVAIAKATARKSTGVQYLTQSKHVESPVPASPVPVHQQTSLEENKMLEPTELDVRQISTKTMAQVNSINKSSKLKEKPTAPPTHNDQSAQLIAPTKLNETNNLVVSDKTNSLTGEPSSTSRTDQSNISTTALPEVDLEEELMVPKSTLNNKELTSSEKCVDVKSNLSDARVENENFLLSLLPDVSRMTDQQFRKLRKYSTALISLIMDGD